MYEQGFQNSNTKNEKALKKTDRVFSVPPDGASNLFKLDLHCVKEQNFQKK